MSHLVTSNYITVPVGYTSPKPSAKLEGTVLNICGDTSAEDVVKMCVKGYDDVYYFRTFVQGLGAV